MNKTLTAFILWLGCLNPIHTLLGMNEKEEIVTLSPSSSEKGISVHSKEIANIIFESAGSEEYGSDSEKSGFEGMEDEVTLHEAALNGDLYRVKYLIEEKHVDVNIEDDAGLTALFRAVEGGTEDNLKVVEYLVCAKAKTIIFSSDSSKVVDREKSPYGLALKKAENIKLCGSQELVLDEMVRYMAWFGMGKFAYKK